MFEKVHDLDRCDFGLVADPAFDPIADVLFALGVRVVVQKFPLSGGRMTAEGDLQVTFEAAVCREIQSGGSLDDRIRRAGHGELPPNRFAG